MFCLNSVAVFVDHSTVVTSTCGHTAKSHCFVKFVWHTTTYIERIFIVLVAPMPLQCLCRTTFIILMFNNLINIKLEETSILYLKVKNIE